MEIQRNVQLAPYSWYRIGGPADFFVEAETEEEVREAVRYAGENELSLFVLGGGSNVLFSDEGFRGLVLHPADKTLSFGDTEVTAGAGTDMQRLLDETIDRGLAGLEWAGGLPGTFGGAVRGNAGCFGGEIKDVVTEVRALIPDTGTVAAYTNTECEFEYRTSRFKRNGEIVLSATLSLARGDAEELRATADEHIESRQKRHPLEYPNCGSVFKNIAVEDAPAETRERFAHAIKEDPFPIIPTAAVLAAVSRAGARVGGAKHSEKHTAFVVNTGDATAADVRAVMRTLADAAREEFGVELEPEVQLVGFN